MIAIENILTYFVVHYNNITIKTFTENINDQKTGDLSLNQGYRHS